MFASHAPRLLRYVVEQGPDIWTLRGTFGAAYLVALASVGGVLLFASARSDNEESLSRVSSLVGGVLVVVVPLLSWSLPGSVSPEGHFWPFGADLMLVGATIWLVGIDWFANSSLSLLRTTHGLLASYVSLPGTVLLAYTTSVRSRFDQRSASRARLSNVAPTLDYWLSILQAVIALVICLSLAVLVLIATLDGREDWLSPIRYLAILLPWRELTSFAAQGVVLGHAAASLFAYFLLAVPILIVTLAGFELTVLLVLALERLVSAGAQEVLAAEARAQNPSGRDAQGG